MMLLWMLKALCAHASWKYHEDDRAGDSAGIQQMQISLKKRVERKPTLVQLLMLLATTQSSTEKMVCT